MLKVQKISNPDFISIIRELFNEYLDELNENLGFQSVDTELDNPFKKYGPPAGVVFIAWQNNEPVGIIALQQVATNTCEMKRLYVRPQHRHTGIASALVKALLVEANKMGYTKMVLDTLTRLQPAIELYKHFGFNETTAYYQNPLPGVIFMERELS